MFFDNIFETNPTSLWKKQRISASIVDCIPATIAHTVTIAGYIKCKGFIVNSIQESPQRSEVRQMSEITTAAFLNKGSSSQFRYVLSLYDEALRLKAESKSKRPQELIKLDTWYQKEFPGKIKARGKDPHIIHDELVTTMKWKLARGKFRPRLKELVTMNSPRVVETESRKAFRALFKKDDLGASIQYLCNLKGIGPATASAIITAAAPERAAFMADECLAAVPEIEGIDYTLQEYLEMLKHIQQAVTRLGGPDEWNPHQVELALWTHHILLTYKPILLQDMPDDTIPPQEDSLGSTMSSDSKEILFNHDSGGDSNSLNVEYNYDLEQSSSFMTTNEDTLDVVDVSHKINSNSNDNVVSGTNNNYVVQADSSILLGAPALEPVQHQEEPLLSSTDCSSSNNTIDQVNHVNNDQDINKLNNSNDHESAVTSAEALSNSESTVTELTPVNVTNNGIASIDDKDQVSTTTITAIPDNHEDEEDYPQTKRPKLDD